MPDASSQTAQAAQQSTVVISDDVRAKFPDLIELLLGSRSMNDEERQYWIDILPVMHDEQVQNLRSILENEKKQLQEIDTKYSSQINAEEAKRALRKVGEERKEVLEKRRGAERQHESQESQEEDTILKQIEDL